MPKELILDPNTTEAIMLTEQVNDIQISEKPDINDPLNKLTDYAKQITRPLLQYTTYVPNKATVELKLPSTSTEISPENVAITTYTISSRTDRSYSASVVSYPDGAISIVTTAQDGNNVSGTFWRTDNPTPETLAAIEATNLTLDHVMKNPHNPFEIEQMGENIAFSKDVPPTQYHEQVYAQLTLAAIPLEKQLKEKAV